jgi:glycosyltransferase involved in cell wall biosynthesis
MECFISIITVTFNSEKTIEDNILSVKRQNFNNYEHIIIDNLSTDLTADIIIKNTHKKLMYLREKDTGMYDAMNKGINLAKGKWIHILNSDDYYHSDNVLMKASNCLRANSLNYFKLNFVTKNKLFIRNYSWVYNSFFMNIRASIPHPTMIIEKKQYHSIGVFDLGYKIASDHDFTLRMCKKYKPFQHDLTLVNMRDGGVSRNNPILVAKEFRDVTIKNGFNFIFAYTIFFYRFLKFKIFVNDK